MGPELLRHADAIVLYIDMHTDIPLPLRGVGFIEGHLNNAPLRGKLNGIGEEVEQDLIQTYTVTADVLCGNIVDVYIKFLLLRLHLGLADAHNPLDYFPQGDLIHIQAHLPAFDLRHVQHVVDEP